jgi:hypothetical protein
MPGSISEQQFLIQKETAPGTLAVNAMRRYRALRAMVGFNDVGDDFRARGVRGLSAHVANMETGTLSIDGIQCYNGITPVLASQLGAPVTTQPDATNAPAAYQHVFTLMAFGSRSPVTHTVQVGDSANAIQLAYMIFNTLTMGVQRSSLTFQTSGISAREPDLTATLASSGIVDVPAVPISARNYEVWMDDDWEDLGTTKMLKCYDLSLSQGDTWGLDAPINSAIAGAEGLLENDEIDISGSCQLAFNAEGKALSTTFKTGATKYVRIAAAVGPLIAATTHYSIQIDFPILITSRGELAAAPNSPRLILPFNYGVTGNPAGGELIQVTLVNTLSAV